MLGRREKPAFSVDCSAAVRREPCMVAVYLDSNATTPVDGRVASIVSRYLTEEYGNAGSRTHDWGTSASRAVERARRQVAAVVDARPDEIIFTSGATEANNIAILGMIDHAVAVGHRHMITTPIEHKAVLEPVEHLAKRHGFEVTLLPVDHRGWPAPEELAAALSPETVLVSTMQVNNETGVELPMGAYADVLDKHPAWWHVDAAQGFGKVLEPLRNHRIDLISMSAHKIYGPKGVGALVARRRQYERPPLAPLVFGGGQERGLRPGTLPVALIAGFGEAASIAAAESDSRRSACETRRVALLDAIDVLSPIINGDSERMLPHVLNVSFPGIDAEAAMMASKDLVAISNGSACTSNSYDPSHVLKAMGLDQDRIAAALRISWSHTSPQVDWAAVVRRWQSLRQ
jgi:cysteine desulfurase